MESSASEEELRYRAVFGAMSEGVVVQSADGAIEACNAAAERILGLTAEQMSGRTSLDGRWRAIREDGSPFEGDEHPAMITLRTGEPQRDVIMGVFRPDGSRSWVSICTAPLARPGERAPYAVVATFADVTRQRDAVAALQRSEAQLRVALAAARMGIWEWSPGGGAVEWSNEVYEVFGVDRSSFDGTLDGYSALVHPEDRARLIAAIESALVEREIGDRFDIHHRIVTGAGEVRWVHCQGRVFRDAAGRPERMLGTVSDVSRQRQTEAELARAQRMDSVGRLAGGIAHDFNNLLTAILGSTDLAVRTLEDNARARELLDIVRVAAQQATRLTGQLLAFARKQTLELSLVPIDDLVIGVEQLLARLLGEDVEIVVRLAAGGAVRADRGQLEQVLVNLAANARDAMPSGGRLTIETSSDALAGDPELGLAPGRYVRIVLSDTGIGMSSDVVERALEPFFTTKESGTGLGLATSYGIVRQLGGHFTLVSAPGAGTRVTLLLPESERGGASPPAERMGPLPCGTETVVLAEDEAGVRDVVARGLRALGYEVLPAADAEEAMRLVESREGDIHLLLTDVVMPGQSGIELAERFVAARPDAAVLLVSGYAPGARLASSAFASLAKPYDMATLARRVRDVLDGVAGAR